MATELSADRKEFARLCQLEIQKAAKLSGTRLPDLETIRIMAVDMAASPSLARIPCQRVPELFAHARANYAESPILRHLVKSAQAIKPMDSPAPSDAPRLAPPKPLFGDAAKWRHLAAVRTAIAEGGGMANRATSTPSQIGGMEIRAEPWMEPFLVADPKLEEVQEMIDATPVGVAWFLANPGKPPYWGRWIKEYGLAGEKPKPAAKFEEEDEDNLPF